MEKKSHIDTLHVIDPIPVTLNAEKVAQRLHLDRTGEGHRAQELVDFAQPLIRAVAAYRVCYIDSKDEGGVAIEGIPFRSRVLRKNLESVGRVFLSVVTVGKGLEEKARGTEDLLEKYYLDAIANMALHKARQYFQEHLETRFALGDVSFMSPGSLEDWPLEEQKTLFSTLGDVEGSVGVRLTDNMLMIPTKSVSGIYFPTDIPFYSCQLCPREKCQGRRAKYDKKLAQEYGLLKE
jgi:hypothetical protein